MKYRTKHIVIIVVLLLTLSCAQKKKIYVAPKAPIVPTPHQTVLPPVPPPAAWTVDNAMAPAVVLPELRDDEPAQTLLDAVDLTLAKFATMDNAAVYRFGAESVPVSRIVASLTDFRGRLAAMGLSEEFFRYVRENYVFYASAAPQVIFTGYYEPLLYGSRRESPKYPYPLYARPGDLVTVDQPQFYFYKDQPNLPQIKGRVEGNRLVPYYTRERDRFPSQLARPQAWRSSGSTAWSTSSSCTSRARGSSSSRTAAASTWATPTRTASPSAPSASTCSTCSSSSAASSPCRG